MFFIYFFYGRLILRPWLTEVRESFTRAGPWVQLEKLLLGFFLVILERHGGPKSDEIWRIFRPHPQTFCSHARMWQNIVILKKKNLLSTDDCSTRKRVSMLHFANVYLLIYLFIYFHFWPPYSPALVNGSSRKFYTWWILSVIREVTTWFFPSSSSLNDRVGQKVTKFGVFSDLTRKLSALTPECGRIL